MTSQLQVPLFVTRNQELSIYGFSLSPNDDRIVDPESESPASLVLFEESSNMASSKGAFDIGHTILRSLIDEFPVAGGNTRPEIELDSRLS